LTPRARLPLAVLIGVVVRVPFWAEALRTPVDGDTAITGLMARHPLAGTAMWGQPYGSPVEAWLLAPVAAAFGWTDDALRLGYFLLGLALIPLAWAVGAALHPRAAWPAAALAAVPPPYLLLLSSMPPPLYPTSLLLNGLVLLLALRAGNRLRDSAGSPATSLALAGTAGGLALWTHLMSATTIAACAAWLFVRARRRRRVLLAGLLPLLLFSAPWWVRAVRDREARRIVRVSDRQETFVRHLAAVLPRMHEPVGGLLGTHVPLVADEPGSTVAMPPWLAAAVVLAYGITLVLAVRAARESPGAGLLLLCAALAVLAFPIPVRAGPSAVRFLTLLWLPVTALVAGVAAQRSTGRRALLMTLTFLVLHVSGGARLLEAWRGADRTQPPFLLVDLRPVRELLDAHGIRHAYASYGPAWRLTWSTRERIVASQPWNERFLHYPLPYLDEVRFAKDTAWVLTPSVPTDLPPPRRFEDLLGAAGGAWRRAHAGAAVVYYAFQPPFGASVAPLEGAGAAGDGDPATALAPAPAEPVTFEVRPPRPLDAVTVTSGASGPRLPRSLDVEVSDDGVAFTAAAKRRRRGEREDLRWVNGHPQFVVDNDVLSVPLGGRVVSAVRLRPVDSRDPWSVGEVLLHPARDPAARAPWHEWLDPGLGWAQRRAALRERPLRDRADWYARSLLAARAR
jgi:hypothetical protein